MTGTILRSGDISVNKSGEVPAFVIRRFSQREADIRKRDELRVDGWMMDGPND